MTRRQPSSSLFPYTALSGSRGDHLVHHRHVRLDAEDLLGELDASGLAAGRRAHGDLHGHLPPFTASRTMTTPPLGPGTEPFTRSEEHTLNSSHANISYAVFC